MAQRTCLACGKPLTGTARRKYCDNNDKCKRRYQRGQRAEGAPDPAAKPPEQGLRSIEAATLLTLGEAKRLGTPLGQAALVLARRLDGDRDTGQGVASLAKQLESTLAAATADVEQADDPIDELRAARERKRAASAAG